MLTLGRRSQSFFCLKENRKSLKGNQKANETASNKSVNNQQSVRKKKVLRSLRDYLYKLIYSSWYCNENSNIIKLILNELDVKTNCAYAMKLLFAAAEIIHILDQGEGVFFSKLNQFSSECIKHNSNRPTLTIKQFDHDLYRWAETVWLRTLDEIHRQSRKKHFNNCFTQ